MSALRDFLATLLGGSAVATGADPVRPSQDRTAPAAPTRLAADDANENWRRTDRAREIELRILMSNWM